MRTFTALALALLSVVTLTADDRNIQFDASVDFSTIKTFAFRNSQINSQKPELNNRLFVQALTESARATLIARGLKEVADNAAVFIDLTIAGADYSGSQRGGPIYVPGATPGRGRWMSTGPEPDRFTEGTLVIDMTTPAGALVWRGTCRDEEPSAPTLARKLPNDAKTLLGEFPPGR